MLSLFEGGDEEAGPADNLRVVTLLDRGVQEARTLDREPAVQAELYQTLGGIYQKLGKLDQADTLLQSALDEAPRALSAPSTPRWRRAWSRSACCARTRPSSRRRSGSSARASTMREAAAPPERDPAIATATAALGHVLENRGDYEGAIAVLEEAVRLQSRRGRAERRPGREPDELANAHFYAGHYDMSESLNRRVLAIDRQLYGARHPDGRRRPDQPGRHPVRAGPLHRGGGALPGGARDHPGAGTATITGDRLRADDAGPRVCVAQKRYDEAARPAAPGARDPGAGLRQGPPAVASALNELGNVAMQQGRLDEAEAELAVEAEQALRDRLRRSIPIERMLRRICAADSSNAKYRRARRAGRRRRRSARRGWSCRCRRAPETQHAAARGRSLPPSISSRPAIAGRDAFGGAPRARGRSEVIGSTMKPSASMRNGYSLVPCAVPRYFTTRSRRVETCSSTRWSSRITQSETYSSRP